MRWKIIVACLVMVCAAAPGAAQVHRCTDAAGKTLYSDAPCIAGQSGALVEGRKSREEILEERLQAAQANERKYRQQAAERAQQQSTPAVPPVTAPIVAPDKSASYECRQAQRDYETVSSIRGGTDEERRNRINASAVKLNVECDLKTEMIQPPAIFVAPARSHRRVPGNVHCEQGFCPDVPVITQPRAGPGLLVMPGGKTCYRAGGTLTCN